MLPCEVFLWILRDVFSNSFDKYPTDIVDIQQLLHSYSNVLIYTCTVCTQSPILIIIPFHSQNIPRASLYFVYFQCLEWTVYESLPTLFLLIEKWKYVNEVLKKLITEYDLNYNYLPYCLLLYIAFQSFVDLITTMHWNRAIVYN